MAGEEVSGGVKAVAAAADMGAGELAGAGIGFAVGGPAGAAIGAIIGGAIEKMTKKITDALKNASPQYQQTSTIFQKSMLLILRPIGDLFSKLFRPMAMALLRFALKWYQLFGQGSEGANDPEDLLESLEEEKKILESMGDTEGAEQAQKKIDAVQKYMDENLGLWNWYINKSKEEWQKLLDAIDWAKNLLSDTWTWYVNKSKEEWQKLLDFIQWAKDDIEKDWENLKQAFEVLKDGISNVWANYIVPAWQALKDDIASVWELFFVPVWDLLVADLNTIWEKLLKPAWDDLVSDIGTIWDLLKGAFDSVTSAIKNWASNLWKKKKPNVDEEDEEGHAAGIVNVQKTGIYKLHAGETVLTAGQSSFGQGMSRTVNISNTFNIPTTELDDESRIRELARKLASLTEIELRRRSSY